MQFKDIKRQTVTANHLTEIIDSGRVSHTQLFLGETASGSLALAIAYAQYLNCEHRQHYDGNGPDGLRADSCGECPSCKKYQQLSHSDLHLYFPYAATSQVKGQGISAADFQGEFREFLNAKHQTGTLDEWYEFMQIENKQGMIRERDADDIVRTLGLKSYEGGGKVAIIWMAEKMNLTTANKILKCLEEPTPNTLIVLVAESTDKMLSTIISRTQLVKIRTISNGFQNVSDEFRSLYVTWMRQLFKLNMASLSAWVDTMNSKSREVQKQFLLFAQESIRDSFLCNNAGLPSQIDFGDEKFNASFPAMITERNIELLNNAFNEAIFAIERNAYGKIAFMELSFRISKALKKR
jgi:DNA polymerase-3 subunit delta'